LRVDVSFLTKEISLRARVTLFASQEKEAEEDATKDAYCQKEMSETKAKKEDKETQVIIYYYCLLLVFLKETQVIQSRFGRTF
jgi:hypothetical protein